MLMKQNIAKKWVKALRSGKYTQGKDYLKSEDGHCCLGVLCELAREEIPLRIEKLSEGTYFDDEMTVLPSNVKVWAGMRSSVGNFLPEVGLKSLAEKNDAGATFKEIADIIEERAKDL